MINVRTDGGEKEIVLSIEDEASRRWSAKLWKRSERIVGSLSS